MLTCLCLNVRRASKLALAVATVGFASGGASCRTLAAGATAQEDHVLGLFRPQPALTLYLVNPASAATAGRIEIRRGWRREGDRVLFRVFDPDEKLTLWQYLEPGKMEDTWGPGDGELWGIPLSIPDTILAANDLLGDIDFSLVGAGVHQLRVAAGARNSGIRVHLNRLLPFGVSFQNGNFQPWDEQVTTTYLFVPAHAEVMQIVGEGIKLFDDAGTLCYPTDGNGVSQKVTDIPVSRTGVVWRMEFENPKAWHFRAAGFPVILCPDAEAAKLIRASIEELPDGTVVCHKFQKRIAELLPSLLSPDKIGRAEDLVKPLAPLVDEWVKDPARNEWLVNPYGPFPGIPAALRGQNVDPASHWSGSLSGWQEKLNLAPPQNRWDRLRTVDGLYAGASSSNGATAENLAFVALLDAPLNPYHGRTELLYRAAAAALRDLMVLGEDEVWRGVGADTDAYPGMMGFVVAQKTFPVYALVAPRMPPEVRDVWTEALRHIVDRSYPDMLVTCRNQSSHYLVSFQNFADGSGDPRYRDLARRYAERFVRSAHPAGFQIEQCGPDGTYNGMTHWHEAVYQRESNDPVMLEGIRKSYTFFNHTVAPEPDGSMLGASNYGHRTAGSFVQEQWGGARFILDDRLPEVGLWAPREKTPAEIAKAASDLRRTLAAAEPEKPINSNITTPRYAYHGQPDRTGVWPAKEAKPFIREFAGEMVAVKRPGYYTMVYVGKPAPVAHYISGRAKFRHPLPDNAENTGGSPDFRKVTPFLGGGLSLFWTPDYGSALLAANWTPVTHHGLLVTSTNDERFWEDYFATTYALDKAAGSLIVQGKVESTRLNYRRQYLFGDQELTVKLEVTADKEQELSGLVEVIPLAMGAAKVNGATLSFDGKPEPVATTAGLTIVDKNGAGVEFLFDVPVNLTVQRNGPKINMLQIGRAEVRLPTGWHAGDKATLGYRIRPLGAIRK